MATMRTKLLLAAGGVAFAAVWNRVRRRVETALTRPRPPEILEERAYLATQPGAGRLGTERTDPRFARSRPSGWNIFSGLDFEDILPPIEPGIDVKDIFLRRLSVEPDAIGPFGAAVLSWEVEAPPQVRVMINSEFLAQSGSKVVQPAFSTTYGVVAHTGTRKTALGHVDLTVDLSACVSDELANPRSALEAPLNGIINAMEDIYARGRQIVEFEENLISCRLNLGAHVDYFVLGEIDVLPDPTIRIDCSFGVRVSDGRLASWGEQVSADVTVPPYVWLVPGALPGLAIALDMAKDKAEANGFNVIAGLVQLLEFWTTPAKGMRRHSIRVGRTEDGAGQIAVTHCPEGILDRFAALDENRVVIG